MGLVFLTCEHHGLEQRTSRSFAIFWKEKCNYLVFFYINASYIFFHHIQVPQVSLLSLKTLEIKIFCVINFSVCPIYTKLKHLKYKLCWP